ncbi:MAG: glutamate--cysteine ligase [Pseudomonadota bacterium]
MTESGFERTLRRLADGVDVGKFAHGLIGVEKESLRAAPDGTLVHTPHPSALGSALTNRFITTDFSEALLEFVTPANTDYPRVDAMLADLHRFAYRAMGDELLWPNSMPCRVGGDDSIPLANYGSSNVGTMKTVYRRGLGHRYGRVMQTIAGLHFNYSLPTDLWPELAELAAATDDVDGLRSATYLGLLRNHRRYGWLLLYLFGASPAMCKSFVEDRFRVLPELNADTVFEPYATSLRMSDLGYSNKTQARLAISLNTLDDYIDGLCRAISTPEPEYQDIGVKVDGRYRQLNANVLQIENEYYSPMRPKRVARSGERPTRALSRGGIEYVELRSIDLDPFAPIGLELSSARFIELFLIYCLLEESPLLDADELSRAHRNHALTASFGRDPGLMLNRDGADILLTDWALRIFDRLAALAELIDSRGDTQFAAAVSTHRERITDAGNTPSARLITAIGDRNLSFIEFGLELARAYRTTLAQTDIDASRLADFVTEADDSINRQRDIEASDAISFDEYLARYFDEPC